MEAIHISGVLLPEAEKVDLYLVDGKISYQKPAEYRTLADQCWIAPGLVDAHCHIGLGVEGAVSDETILAQAKADLAAGVLLVRDAGTASDTRWVNERADLPRIIRAGRHIARPKRYLRHLAVEIQPGQLVDEVATQAQAGDGWVKLVGDWIDRETGDLDRLWDFDEAKLAIAKAHELGAKVTAHCFAESSVYDLVRAGIDCIEHGTGLDDETISLMAANNVALVPTMFNLENFPGIANQATKYPVYAEHMRKLYRSRLDTLGKCLDAGVQIYAGTDAGTVIKHGSIGEEITRLASLGGVEFALGAASWRAKRWLLNSVAERTGQQLVTQLPFVEQFFAEGAPADLVIYLADPLVDAQRAASPDHVVLGGQLIR